MKVMAKQCKYIAEHIWHEITQPYYWCISSFPNPYVHYRLIVPRGAGDAVAPQIGLTYLQKLGGSNQEEQIMPTKLLQTLLNFQTFQRPCTTNMNTYILE